MTKITGVQVKTHLNDESRGMNVLTPAVIADHVTIEEEVIVVITTNVGAIAEIEDIPTDVLKAVNVTHLYADLLSTNDDAISVMGTIATYTVGN